MKFLVVIITYLPNWVLCNIIDAPEGFFDVNFIEVTQSRYTGKYSNFDVTQEEYLIKSHILTNDDTASRYKLYESNPIALGRDISSISFLGE